MNYEDQKELARMMRMSPSEREMAMSQNIVMGRWARRVFFFGVACCVLAFAILVFSWRYLT